ncbi:MAG TPA: DUF2806 domain-containing protein [Ignavibacteriaceae bacterium]|nr:DUF2806 domain-containing protein [Ignavibacteriaceae bacterium]
MEIKDLAGLSEPLKKLISVIAHGLGAISKPYLIKKTADAKAYEIKVIAQAIKDNQSELKRIDYSSDKIELHSLDVHLIKTELEIKDRATNRIGYQEQKRQQNIEEITQKAANQLRSESEVSNEPVDADWTTRFFNLAQDISEEEMQNLWAQVLAGEVKQPKSYSLRTLELLKNITKDEAQIFVKAANFVISSNTGLFIYKEKGDNFLSDYGLSFENTLLLSEVGLLQTEFNLVVNLGNTEKDNIFYFEYGHYLIKVTKKANSSVHKIPLLRFSTVGEQLFKLIKIYPVEDYLKKFCLSMQSDNIQVEYTSIIKKNIDGTVDHTLPWQKFEK